MAKGRRGNNEGSITKRKDGRWQGAITIGYDSNGKPKRVYFYGKTRGEVSDKIVKALNENTEGRIVEPNKVTVGQWLDKWLNYYAKINRSITTWERYETLIRNHINPAIGKLYLRKMRTVDIQKFYADCLDSRGVRKDTHGLSSGTVLCIHAIINMSLKQAVKEKLVATNVCDSVVRPKKGKAEINILTLDQINKYISVAKPHYLFTAFLLESCTGLRRGELLGLKWSDLDFKNISVTVQRTLVYTIREGLVLKSAKTKTANRNIPLTPKIMEAMKEHKKKQIENKLLLGQAYADNDLVFCTKLGTPIHPRNFIRIHKNILSKADLPDISFHSLRHSHASLLLAMGEHPKVVQERLGHSDISTTVNIYSHLVKGLQENASEKISAAIQF